MTNEVDRFWNKVLKPADSSCWLWRGATNRRGYGVFFISKGKTEQAHRFSYKLAHPRTSIDSNVKLCVMHRCDTRRCVNPEHLRAGTRKQNSQDMVRKGRAPAKRGTSHGNAKLSWAIVRGIRKNYKGGWGAIRALCEIHGVSKEAIKDVLAGRTWKES